VAQPPKPTEKLKAINVPGHWERNLDGEHHYPTTVEALRPGPLKVSLRFKPSSKTEPYAIAAFVGGRQVGWLVRQPSRSDPYVEFLKRLNARNLMPQISGECRLSELSEWGRKHVILFMPSDDKLTEIADRLVNTD
jgi:hypothetical protein